MSRGSLALAAFAAALTLAAPAAADPPKSITATGTALVKVRPKHPHSNASISAAVDAARKTGITGAIDDAHEYAADYARAAGMTLGSIISVSDVQSNGYGPGYGFGFFGPFGPDRYCGKLAIPVFKKIQGKRKVVRVKHVHRCFVPPFEATILTVTYSAS